MQVIDQDYINSILALEDGNERICRWILELIHERDDAQMVAKALLAQLRGQSHDD